ncbi:MAG: arginine--tRNA ligase [archaeon]|jgi:arginyl-tRNA synthetase
MDFKESIANLMISYVDKDVALGQIVVAPNGMGDFAFPCFVLAKQLQKNPLEISKQIEKELMFNLPEFLEKVVAVGPYINFFINKSTLSNKVLANIFDSKEFEKLGSGKVMVEYSAPNTNKPLHLGHLRNNVLGLAISNLLDATGHNVIKANLVNDRGVHICKSMLAYQKYGEGKTPESEGMKSDHFVGKMYVLFNEKLKENPTLEEEAQAMLKKWEDGDKETIKLWKKMNKWAIDGMKTTYNNYGTKFDEWFLESELFANGNKDEIIKEGLDKGVFQKEDNGAISAILEDVGLPNKILLRGDGTSLYATNDLMLTQAKFEKFKLDKAIWVVANEQDLYFKQLFKIFEKLGRSWAQNCFHLSYGYVSLTTGKMKSREGTVVDADDLLTEIYTLAKTEVDARYIDLKEAEKAKRAKAIAQGAIKFYLLKNDAKKDMVFDPKESLSFEGETGPYLQYTYARAKSILRKAKKDGKKYTAKNFDLLKEDKEKELITELGNFDLAIKKSWEQLSLHPLAHHLLAIAEKFNSFYHEINVLNSNSQELLNARLSLIEATTKILAKGFLILDITALEEM